MALVMQGKHAEAMVELSKICLVWRIFPPEESSQQMFCFASLALLALSVWSLSQDIPSYGLPGFLMMERKRYLADSMLQSGAYINVLTVRKVLQCQFQTTCKSNFIEEVQVNLLSRNGMVQPNPVKQ
ncbi:PREDICTED: uncharacterized protein LOC101306137 [Fragaria vesca subsp. vesca]